MEHSAVNGESWYPLRVSGGDCMEFKRYLDGVGIRCWFNETAFRGICFVRSTAERLEQVKKHLEGRFTVHYLWDGMTFRPARIDDKRMNDFITVADAGEGDSLYLERVSTLLKDCHKVRVTSGKFSGIEGKLVRIRKSKRVMVELPGDLAVATEYIRPECLEFID